MLPAAGLTKKMDAIPQYGKQMQYATINVNRCNSAAFFFFALGWEGPIFLFFSSFNPDFILV